MAIFLNEITRDWMNSKFSGLLKDSHLRIRFDDLDRLQSVHFVITNGEAVIFESRCLEITEVEAVFFYTMGTSSGDPRGCQTYVYDEIGYRFFSGHPDFGEFKIEKISFSDWVKNCISQIELEAGESKFVTKFPGRSLQARKPRFL